jgi:uncharacterized protein with HEPN domain
MPEDDELYLSHMLETARKAIAKSQAVTREIYDEDENLRLALAHLVQILGEAARHVTFETQASHPDIPWREIVGMRHKIVHDYMNLDEDVLWEVVTHDLRPLVVALEHIAP